MNCVEKISVVSSSVFGADSGRLGDNELLSLKFLDVLGNGFIAHAISLTDGVAREGLSILTEHQVGIDGDCNSENHSHPCHFHAMN